MKKMIFAVLIAAGMMATSFANAQTAEKKATLKPTVHKAGTKPVQAEQAAAPQATKEKTPVKKTAETKSKKVNKTKAVNAK